MKTSIRIFVLAALAELCSCRNVSHNASAVAFGKKLRVGSVEYGDITYLNGFSLIDLSRENSEWQIDIDDEAGISFDPSTQTLRGVKSIRRRIGKQVTGYLNDLSEKSPEAVAAYLAGDVMFAVPARNKAGGEENTTQTGTLDRLKQAASGLAADAKPFDCKDGDCKMKGVGNNRTVAYQLSVALELKNGGYLPDDEKAGESGVTNKQNVLDFIARCKSLRKAGVKISGVYIDGFEIQDRKLKTIDFRYVDDDGVVKKAECVSCIALYELDK